MKIESGESIIIPSCEQWGNLGGDLVLRERETRTIETPQFFDPPR